jgi:hypothetical protein
MRQSHRKRTLRKRMSRKGGGNATNLPAPYFKAPLVQPIADAGHDLLKTVGNMVRPRIGGGYKRQTKKRGGFVPSIMEGFSQMAGKYVLPLAMFAGYRLINGSKSKRVRRTRRTRRTRRV